MDYANGDGLRTSVWFTGCPHACPECHNENLWAHDPNFTLDLDKVIELTSVTKKISILGGEPLAPVNSEQTLTLVKRLRAEIPGCSIYLWTGYEMDVLAKQTDSTNRNILRQLDKVVFGPYIAELRVNNPMFGSSNQYVVEIEELKLVFA